jgi:uncharacterized protein HemX
MSGVTTATIIAGIGAAAAVGGTAYSIVNGQNQQAAQQESLKTQKTAQGEAKAAALSTQRKSETAANAANMKTPDIAGLLSRAAGVAKGGIGSTMLTGSGGVDSSTLNLGKTSLLGG